LRCPYFKREKGEVKKTLCMAEVATLGVAGDPYAPSNDEVIDFCLSDGGFKECQRFKWVEREKDKEKLKHMF
jgi:hypothetical protein